MATTAAAKKPAKQRETAPERKERERLERIAREERQAKAQAEFEARRPQVWNEIWAKALRLALLINDDSDFTHANSWWFDDFRVNPVDQTFCIETLGSGTVVSQERLHASDVQRLNDALNGAFGWREDHLAELERKRLEEIERQRRRDEALSKLTPEDRKVLGLR